MRHPQVGMACIGAGTTARKSLREISNDSITWRRQPGRVPDHEVKACLRVQVSLAQTMRTSGNASSQWKNPSASACAESHAGANSDSLRPPRPALATQHLQRSRGLSIA